MDAHGMSLDRLHEGLVAHARPGIDDERADLTPKHCPCLSLNIVLL